jgi:DNA-nicking Smr family endonuclease
MTRRLTKAERELWDRLRRDIRPLRAAEHPETKAAATEPAPAEAKPDPAKTAAAPLRAAPRREPPLVTLEERTRRRLSRGLAEADARIDLHGMRQERAFAALFSFLRHSQARGAKIVLVITGKGRDGTAHISDGRGVLRHAVPAWLARPEFRDLIVGFEDAARRHGGAGALYVRLRRRNGPQHSA